jgi:hypothetical protein
MIALAAQMISSWLIPADGRKATFSDGRLWRFGPGYDLNSD